MRILEKMSASDILAIPTGEPERLFSGNQASLRWEFVTLAKIWHPDRNAGSAESTEVFERILALHEAAERKLEAGNWSLPNMLRIETVEGRAFLLKVKRRHEFELGECAIAAGRVAYLIEKSHGALFTNGLRRIRDVKYPDAKIETDISRFIPKIEATYETASHHVLMLKKTEDVMLLADLIGHLGGQMPPKHVAWLVSALLNLVCFFEVTGITHNAMSVSTVFVSPKFHAAFPLGGWWYAAKSGAQIEMLPDETFALLPRSMAADKRADIRLDLESVRAIGRCALGDPTGLSLIGRPDLPRPMADYLRLPASRSAIEDYRAWGEVLKDSFGPRRFVELPVTSSDVYT